MPSSHVCFWLEPTTLCEVSYRRYVSIDDRTCTATHVPFPGHAPVSWGYHSTSVTIDRRERLARDVGRLPTEDEKADCRWPKKCDCGYEYQPTDFWQFNACSVYRRTDTGELTTLHKAPVGAMWNAGWMTDTGHNPKPLPDGQYIIVRTPVGDWHVDGPSSSGGNGWTRHGEPPLLVVTPSIEMPGMHGWLGGPAGDQPGVLVIDQP